MRESWEEEEARQLAEVDALLERVADGTLAPFEGAFAAFRILQTGGQLLWHERFQRMKAGEPATDLPPMPFGENGSYCRMTLAQMVDWWAMRPLLRERVESEIVGFARAWQDRGNRRLPARWSDWSRWWHRDGIPFEDVGPMHSCNARKVVREARADLRRVKGIHDVTTLSLWECTLGALDGIERFEQLRDLSLYDVRGLDDLRPINRLEGLASLTISTKNAELAQAATAVDFGALPDLYQLQLHCWAPDVFEPIRIDTSWAPKAQLLTLLDLTGFAPASGAFGDIVAAPKLVSLTITPFERRDVEFVVAQLPLTDISVHEMPRPRPAGDSFGMVSAAGNSAVAAMVQELTDWLEDEAVRPRIPGLNRRLADKMWAIANSGHREIFDTDVREQIAEALEGPVEEAGLDPDRIEFD